MEDKIWMNNNKIHFGDSPTGSSGISYVPKRGVVVESAASDAIENNNVELYAKLSGDIILNTTDG